VGTWVGLLSETGRERERQRRQYRKGVREEGNRKKEGRRRKEEKTGTLGRAAVGTELFFSLQWLLLLRSGGSRARAQ